MPDDTRPVGTVISEYSGGTATITLARWRVTGHKQTPAGLRDEVELIDSENIMVEVAPVSVERFGEKGKVDA